MSANPGAGLVVVCTCRVREGGAAEFERLLERHSPTLRRLGLITGAPVQALRCIEDGAPLFVEVFEWAGPDAAARASEVPAVIAIWEPMAALCEARLGRPALEFPLFDRVGSND